MAVTGAEGRPRRRGRGREPGLGVVRARSLAWWLAAGLSGIVMLLVARGPSGVTVLGMGPQPGVPPEAGPVGTPGPREPGALPGSAGVSQGPLDAATYEARLEAALAAVLSQIRGAGRVAVDVTLEDGGEAVPVTDTSRTRRTTEEADPSGQRRSVSETSEDARVVTVRAGGTPASGNSGGEQPVLVAIRPPAIRGVLVVAQGADEPRVREWLYRAVQTQLGVPLHRVLVLPMEGGG